MIACKYACAGLALVMVAATALAADNERSRSDVLFMSDGTYAPFKTKPAKDLMTREGHRDYLDALNKLDCERAEEQLRAAFVRNYPQFSTTVKKAPETSDAAKDVKSYRWGLYAGVQFPGYGFCVSYSSFRDFENQIRQSNMTVRKYKARPLGQNPFDDKSLIALRDRALRAMIISGEMGYGPALIVIAQLIRRGDIFRGLFDVDAEAEYYFLKRACHLGYNCEPVNKRLEELSTGITDIRRKELTRKAQEKKNYVGYIFSDGGKL